MRAHGLRQGCLLAAIEAAPEFAEMAGIELSANEGADLLQGGQPVGVHFLVEEGQRLGRVEHSGHVVEGRCVIAKLAEPGFTEHRNDGVG